MLIATAYRLGEDFNASTLPALCPQPPPRVLCINISLLHNICGHVNEQLLKHTAKHLGIELEGNMEECTSCSMAKGNRKGIPHQSNSRFQAKLRRAFVDLGGYTKVLCRREALQYYREILLHSTSLDVLFL